MKSNKENSVVYYSIIGLQVLFLIVVYISTLFKSWMFADFIYITPYLLIGITISLVLSFVFISKSKSNGVEIISRLNTLLLMQVPSVLTFAFTIFMVLTSKTIT